MFNNPGSKIKRLGEILFWIAIIIFESYAVYYLITSIKTSFRNIDFLYLLLFAIVYPLSAYISSLFLVAFGELVEKTSDNNFKVTFIARRLSGMRRRGNAGEDPETEHVFEDPSENAE